MSNQLEKYLQLAKSLQNQIKSNPQLKESLRRDPVQWLVNHGIPEDYATDMITHDLMQDTPIDCRVCTDCGCGDCCFTSIE